MGIVYNPFHENIFCNKRKSFLNGQPIKVSKAEKLSDTIIGLGTGKENFADENFARFRRVFRSVSRMSVELISAALGWHILPVEGRTDIRDISKSLGLCCGVCF